MSNVDKKSLKPSLSHVCRFRISAMNHNPFIKIEIDAGDLEKPVSSRTLSSLGKVVKRISSNDKKLGGDGIVKIDIDGKFYTANTRFLRSLNEVEANLILEEFQRILKKQERDLQRYK